MNVFDLFAKISLDTQGFSSGLNTVVSGAKKMGAAVGVAVTAATTAVTVFGKKSVDEAIAFESAFAGVKKTVDETATTSYEDLAKVAMNLATTTSATKEQVAGIMEIAGQLGISADDVEEFSKTIIMLGDSTNLSAEEGASALARFLNITGSGNNTVSQLGATIVALGNNFATTESEIVDMASRLSSAGSQIGLTDAQILGISTALSSLGVQAEMGGSAFSRAIIKMTTAVEKGGSTARKVFEKTGYSISELLQQEDGVFAKAAEQLDEKPEELRERLLKDLNDLKNFASIAQMSEQDFADLFASDAVSAIQAFIHGLGDVETQGKSTIAMLDEIGFSDIRLGDTMRRLAGSSDLLTRAVNMAEAAYSENSALGTEAEKRYGTLQSRISQLSNAFKNFQTIIGNQMTPTLAEFVDFGKNAVLKFADAFEKEGISGFMGAFGEVLSEGLNKVIEFLPEAVDAGARLLDAVVNGLINNLDTVTDSMLKVFNVIVDRILKYVPKLISAVLVIIKKVANYLGKNANIIVDSMLSIIEQILDLFDDEELIDTVIDSAANIIMALADGLAKSAPKILKTVADILVKLLNKLSDPTMLVNIVKAGMNLISQVAKGLIQAIPDLVKALPKVIANLVTALVGSADELVKATVDLIDEILSDDNFPKIIKEILTAWPKIISSLISTMTKPEHVLNMVQGVIDLVNTMLDEEHLPKIINTVLTAIPDIISSVASALTDGENIEKIVTGLKDMLEKVIEDANSNNIFYKAGQRLAKKLGLGFTDESNFAEDYSSSGGGSFSGGGRHFGDSGSGAESVNTITRANPSRQEATGSEPVTIELSIDGQKFGKIMYDLNERERQRRGATVLDRITAND